MERNNILDYEQAELKLKEIVKKGIIAREENLAITEHGLPIEHFSVGKGDKDIVITGATHGSEIITTDFVTKLMESINLQDEIWKKTLKEFKIHFIPMLNPEGYLISTSAVRKLIPQNMSQDEAEKICKQYYKAYREDDMNPQKDKRYQKMFENVSYSCIPDKYKKVKESVKNIFEKNKDLPNGCLQIWSSNGNGIDVQANFKYNPNNTLSNEKVYMKAKRFDNIDTSHPGPINCPFDKERGFKTEIETAAISSLLEDLNCKGRLFLYLNYHSTGGIIYQRPSIPPKMLDITSEEISKNEKINYILSQAYSSRTYKNIGIDVDGIDKRDKTKYEIKTEIDSASSTNDIFRLKYPQNLLIELSGMGGNPIAPYGDIRGNYTNTIESNLDAVKFTLHVASSLKAICEEFTQKIKALKGEEDYELVTSIEERIFNEFYERIIKLKPTQEEFSKNSKKEKVIDIKDDEAR